MTGLMNAHGPLRGFDWRLGKSPATAESRVGFCERNVGDSSGSREFVDVGGNASKNSKGSAVVNSDVVSIRPILLRPQVDHGRATGSKLLDPFGALAY